MNNPATKPPELLPVLEQCEAKLKRFDELDPERIPERVAVLDTATALIRTARGLVDAGAVDHALADRLLAVYRRLQLAAETIRTEAHVLDAHARGVRRSGN